MMIKTLINKKSVLAIFLLLSNFIFSQGLIEVPLHTNQILIKKWEEIKDNKAYYFTPSIADTLDLNTTNFLDDFSYPGPFPDTTLWLNCQVFVNRNYPLAPPTIGVATFDGINSHGYPYYFQAGQTSSEPADTLTSKRIRLNGFPLGDTVFLSFQCQPQGRGNSPEPHDSLVLEFKEKRMDSVLVKDTLAHIYYTALDTVINGVSIYSTLDSFIVNLWDSLYIKEVWRNMWSAEGAPTPADSSWKQVIIPITDTAFLKPGFQFRFYNWATISGNGDQWSIDNVYLNHLRHWNDTIIDDVAWVYDAPSLLKPYYSMPWRHYIDTVYKKQTLDIPLRNNGLNQKLVQRGFKMDNLTAGSNMVPYALTSQNVDIYDNINYYNYTTSLLPVIPFPMTGPTDILFEAALNTTPDPIRRNDTLRHVQTFWNYFAYDDGTAESAFAMNATLIGELAEKFTTKVPDTLRAIDIYFNPLWHDASLYEDAINLKVWSDNGGHPGTELFSDTSQTPWYNQQEYGPDHFKRFQITPYYMSQPMTFYIGFLQNTTLELSVGVDKNTNSQDKIFYRTTGTWYNAPYPGSLMMRPVFGSKQETSSIHSVDYHSNSFSVYPNPATDKLNLIYNSDIHSDKISYSIFDLFGRKLMENVFANSHQQNSDSKSESLDITSLSEGIYFITLSDGIATSTAKFIKIK